MLLFEVESKRKEPSRNLVLPVCYSIAKLTYFTNTIISKLIEVVQEGYTSESVALIYWNDRFMRMLPAAIPS